ncbi:hypothetical protein AVBRAN12640_02420 [Campylobacter sp. RM12640]|uniref:hypothetical protein n=1 Tax=unclassified Campylobacter TaxID=2593542 RepID=UPI00301568EF|nr:hypothetical protein [Campylobacter sp. RM12640]MBZ7989010.1 hypothetical protein [Campylobacter sp. RM12635]
MKTLLNSDNIIDTKLANTVIDTLITILSYILASIIAFTIIDAIIEKTYKNRKLKRTYNGIRSILV